MSDWIQITAYFAEEPSDWSPVVSAFMDRGCPSVLQDSRPPHAQSCLQNTPGAEAVVEELREALRALGANGFETHVAPDTDWDQVWRDHFKARKVGRCVIVPTWETYRPEPGEVPITLDPGQAFGTGDHPTTRLCLRLLQDVPLEGMAVADVGCGTGVLAIAAHKMGAHSVLGSDIDELSVDISRQNGALNEVDVDWIAIPGFDAVAEPVDVLLSNIISATLIRLAPEAPPKVKPGGLWIVSGIIHSNWPDVRHTIEKAGFALENHIEEDDWVAARFRR